MPALPYHNLQARNDTAGRNFTIIFGTAAVVVIVSCLIFGYVFPKLRTRRPPPPPSAHFAIQNTFPSHPAVCRDFRKSPSSQLRQYDPRCETPFPCAPPRGESVSLSSITPRSRSAVDLRQADHQLFLSAKDRLPSRRGPEPHTDLDRFPAESRSANEIDDSLTIPEPCLLRARSAGKAPPLKRHLDKFPLPQSASANSEKLAHPNKLFRELGLRDSKTGVCTPSPLVPEDEPKFSHVARTPQLPHGGSPSTRLNAAGGKNGNTFELPQEYEMNHWRLRRLERRGTWSSNAEARPARLPIERAGTVTRLKTPVADPHSPYDSKKSLGPPSSKNGTISSSEYQESTLFSQIDLGTPPTSPVDVSALSNQAEGARHDAETPTPCLSSDRATLAAIALPTADRLAPMSTIPEGRPTDAKKTSIFKQVRPLTRHRPAKLNLSSMRKSPSLRKRFQRHSMSSVSSLLVPLVRPKRPSIQASSIYSRDTLGVSIVRTPVSPAFSENTSAGASNRPEVVHRKASSMDLLQNKIDDWRLDTPEIENFSTSPSSEFKRALSDFGPCSPTFPDSAFGSVYKLDKDVHEKSDSAAQVEVPTICIGRASDDIFRDPVPDIEANRVLKRMLDVGGTSMPSLIQAPKEGTAPGGADWV